MSNKLKIDASQLKLEFSGSKQDIRRGYDMTRELLIMHFHEQLARAERERLADANTEEPSAHVNRKTRSWIPPSEPKEAMHISIALCSDFYNKVCVLEREEYEGSIFQDILNFDVIERLYIRSNQKDAVERHIKIGKVLWRELTPDGRAAVRSE
tara:strand:- start:417 stop:878 length:462 start_codon:yes stop_codon:yes gene_type:complete